MTLPLPEIVYGEINKQKKLLNVLTKNRKAFLIVDQNTLKCRELLYDSVLSEIPFLILKSGEENKSISQISEIWNFLNHQKATRNDIVFLLGGGIICDMGAFATSTFKRGLDFVNIPTSLLAMVDASIGGKTGFNFNHFKNNIGTFSHPIKIFNDVRFLKTLPKNELLSGMAEVFKHAIISDSFLWKYLSENNVENLDYFFLIKKSAELKIQIVQKDPYEMGIRKSLNLGHTIGHAIESYLIEKNISTMHGFAVAQGLVIETYIAYKIRLTSKQTFLEIRNVLHKYFGQHLNLDFEIQKVMTLMKGDKKNLTQKINFSLPKAIGNVLIDQEIDCNELEKILLEFLKND